MPINFNMKKTEITIIGGGAAGLTAAIFAARAIGGNQVCILEKNDRLGRKLLATGNGRCNMTNTNCTYRDLRSADDNLDGKSDTFIREAFSFFSVAEALAFFEELGVLWREEDEGRIYPYSEQASAVQEALVKEIVHLGVAVCYHAAAAIRQIEQIEQIIKPAKQDFEITLENGEKIITGKIILATGGKAGIQYGSAGDGFRLAKSLHHSVIGPLPSLVQITSEDNIFKPLKGVRAKAQAALALRQNSDGSKKSRSVEQLNPAEEPPAERIIAREKGEIQFTEDGLSGICIFNLSRFLRESIKNNEYYVINIDLLPEFDEKELLDKLTARQKFLRMRQKEDFLHGILNKKLAPVILGKAKISSAGTVAELRQDDLARLAGLLKSWTIKISGTKGWKEAQVTSGGIRTSEIHAGTMESKLVPGLYFAGEVIDVDGRCGGYNLQWAWTSGAIAGKAAANKDTSGYVKNS